jgi:hypothetical protein
MPGAPIARRVPQGRLNLAQDVVLGEISRDDKSRRDDWKLRGSPRQSSPKYSAIENSRRVRASRTHVSTAAPVVPTGLFNEHSNPGLHPGLSSAVPTDSIDIVVLTQNFSSGSLFSLSSGAFSQISTRLCSIKCRVSTIGSTSESDSIE